MSDSFTLIETRIFFFFFYYGNFANSAKIIKLVSKRKTTDTLTGGTGDVSPQLFSGVVAQTVANTYRELSFPVPVQRYNANQNRALVMEVLKVFYDLSEPDNNNAAGGSVMQITAQISTKSQPLTALQFPQVISLAQKSVRGAFTAAGTYGSYSSDPLVMDLTDGAGHGY